MKVVIRLAELQAHKACDDYLRSPEWDEGQQALVYSDWDATVARHFAMGPLGVVRLGWLVGSGLVPMTAVQFIEARRRILGGSNG